MIQPQLSRRSKTSTAFFKGALVTIVLIANGFAIAALLAMSGFVVHYLVTADDPSWWSLLLIAFYGMLLFQVLRSVHRFCLKFSGLFPDGGLLFFLPRHRAHRDKSMS